MVRGYTVLVAFLALSVPGLVSAWSPEIVDSGGVGAHSSLKVGPGDRIHISYMANSYGYMKYAFFNGSSWTKETVDPTFLCGQYTAIDLDSSGNPHIAYLYYTGRSIRYASKAGLQWTWTEFASDPDMESDLSMAIDADDHPHVSYDHGVFTGEPHDLNYAYFDGSDWITASVDTQGQVGRGSSIGVDSSRRPHISYYDETNITLKYAHFDGSQWRVSAIDDVEFIGFNFRTAIAVDSQDRVHIVYSAYHYEAPNWSGRLKYAMHDEAGWHVSIIDQALPTRDFRVPAITIDPSDRPHVSYLLYYNAESIDPDMKYARFDGTAWLTEFADTRDIPDSGYSNAIDLDAAQRPHLCFCMSGVTLVHTSGDAPSGMDQAPPIRDAAGFALYPPSPNPARGRCTVSFVLPRACDASLEVFDPAGRQAATAARGHYGAGEHAAELSGTLPSGVYMIRLRAGSYAATQKLVVN